MDTSYPYSSKFNLMTGLPVWFHRLDPKPTFQQVEVVNVRKGTVLLPHSVNP